MPFTIAEMPTRHIDVVESVRALEVTLDNMLKKTPLQLAAELGNLDLVTTLLRQGANPNDRHKYYDCSALDYAVKNNHKQIVYKLLRAGVNVNSRNRHGNTAFYHSQVQNSFEIACMMLYYEADPSLFKKDTVRVSLHPKTWKLFEVLCFSYDCIDENILRVLITAIRLNPVKLGNQYTPKLTKMLEKFSEIVNTKSDSCDIHESVSFEPYYYYLSLFDICINSSEANNLRLIWLSLSSGIDCCEIYAAIERLGYGKESLALIWGSSRKSRKSLRLTSCFTNGFIRRNDEHDGQGFKVKTLAKLSRNATRLCIIKRFETKSFYEVHEVVNNLDIPTTIKRLLQFRISVNCNNCKFTRCYCDVGDEFARSYSLAYTN